MLPFCSSFLSKKPVVYSQVAATKKLSFSPLATHALERGFSPNLIFTPQKAGDIP